MTANLYLWTDVDITNRILSLAGQRMALFMVDAIFLVCWLGFLATEEMVLLGYSFWIAGFCLGNNGLPEDLSADLGDDTFCDRS